MPRTLIYLLLLWCAARWSVAGEPPRPQPGALVIAGGGTLPEPVYQAFVERAGGAQGRLVLIPTASELADRDDLSRFTDPWQKYPWQSVAVLHTRDRQQADSEAFVAVLREATAVWISGGEQRRLAQAYVGTRVERELHALLERGGVVGGSSAGAAIMSRTMIVSGNPRPEIGSGLGLLSGIVIDQHFLRRNRLGRLLDALRRYPSELGIGIDEGTALVVEGRQIEVVGDSYAIACWQSSAARPSRFEVLKAGDRADLLAMVRAAQARQTEPFPPAQVSTPHVRQGSLMIVGGGRMDAEMWQQFVELAGGPDAPIVVIPSAGEQPEARAELAALQKAGARKVQVLHAATRDEADRSEVLAGLSAAQGIWFGGGRQWRLVDAFEQTRALESMHQVLARGGVIGGSSAGATIQGEYLVRGHPLGNTEMMAEGYERGFAFLPGTAIDQHFTQRRREGDMLLLKRTFPQLWGIGIDEGTALIVSSRGGSVLGAGSVYIYPPAQAEAVRLLPGSRYQFAP